MRVGTAEISVNDLVNQIKARNMAKSKRIRTPNCTHVDMDRVYGQDQQCYVCGREPSIGFLYECKQDCDAQSLHDLLEQEDEDPIEVAKSDMRLQLEWAGLSESVIRAAELGQYTTAQLEKLKTQKHELRQTISDTLQAAQINSAASKLAAMEQALLNHDGAGASKTRDACPPACAFKACHTCRPYYRDRVYISFDSVVHADFPPITPHDVDILPTKSAQIMKSIGKTSHSPSVLFTTDTTTLSVPTSNSLSASTDAPPTASTTASTASDLTFKTTQSDLDEISAQRRPRRRFYRMGHRTSGDIAQDLNRQSNRLFGLRTAVQNIFHAGRDSSSDGSNITLPLPQTGTVRNPDDPQEIGEFDLPALRKVRKEKERHDFKRGSLVAGFENVHTGPAAINQRSQTPLDTIFCNPTDENGSLKGSKSGSSDFSIYISASEGSEVEVDGGVALTEEAVETHTPDILAVPISRNKNAVEAQDVELTDEEENAAGADVGMQSIMAQV